MKDQLYLLRPGFHNAEKGPFYCGDSVAVEGLLSFFPQLRTLIDVHYLEFPRPRKILVDTLGAEHQGVPVLILSPDRKRPDSSPAPQQAQGNRFIANEQEIRQYLSAQYGLPAAS
jgi:hypothetical protein